MNRSLVGSILERASIKIAEEKVFFKSANQKQELPMVAMFVNGSELNEQSL
jgi:ribonucleotide reductase alpha subunit